MKYKIFTLIFSLFIFVQLFGQNIVLKGTVINSKDKKPISNVNILIKDSYIGTITNENGYFRLIIDTSKVSSKIVIISHVKYNIMNITFDELKIVNR